MILFRYVYLNNMMTKTLTYIHNIHILPRMHVLLFLCDSKVSLAVARRASDV